MALSSIDVLRWNNQLKQQLLLRCNSFIQFIYPSHSCLATIYLGCLEVVINYFAIVFLLLRRLHRNRLENNTEHWNALLLSLRELIEWVIRKDTELTGLGPIRGDLLTLIKQQVWDHLALAFFSFMIFIEFNVWFAFYADVDSFLIGLVWFGFACRMTSERSGGNLMTNGHWSSRAF